MRKPLSAYDKLIDYLSRRDHSEFELRNKLLHKGFVDAEIDEALEKVKAKGFLGEPQELAEKAAEAAQAAAAAAEQEHLRKLAALAGKFSRK